MKTTKTTNTSGSTLAVVVSVLATLMVIVAVAAEYSYTISRHVQRSNTLENAIAVGDGCIEILYSNWRKICSTGANIKVPQTSSAFTAIATPSPGQLNLPVTANFVKRGTGINPNVDELNTDYTISNYKVIAVDAEWNALASAAATPKPMLGQLAGPIAAPSPSTSVIYNYIASADVTLPAIGQGGQVVAKVRRVFQKQQISPWNFAIFYVDPLEIHPGPQFTVTGWVHTNSDLFTGHDTLTFADKVTYGSDWYVGFMPGEEAHKGETPTAPTFPDNLPPARDQSLQPFGLDSTSIFNSSDSNPNNDSYRELVEPPSTSYTDPIADARYWNQAAIVIEVSDNPSTSAAGFDGVAGHDLVKFYVTDPSTGVATQISSSSTGNNLALYNMFKYSSNGPISTNESIQDNREGATMKVTSIDISKIVTTVSSGNPSYTSTAFTSSSQPIIYAYHKSATSAKRRAIRVEGASKIPTAGLTVASNNPVYIQGDVNTGGTNTSVPSNQSGAYNNGATPNPQVSGYTRAPVSIAADAVTILSNNWSDSNSTKDLQYRAASNTTVNAAIIAGIVPSAPVGGDGSYSGGAENFPRFLEDWGQRSGEQPRLTYYGSMVQLYKSVQSIGEWGSSNVYSAPNRRWFFDNNLKTLAPPGSVMVYSYIKGKWSVL